MKENCEPTVNEMLVNLPKFERDLHFQQSVVTTILDICTTGNYANVINFEWLVTKVILPLSICSQSLDKRLASIIIEVCSCDPKLTRFIGEVLTQEQNMCSEVVQSCLFLVTEQLSELGLSSDLERLK